MTRAWTLPVRTAHLIALILAISGCGSPTEHPSGPADPSATSQPSESPAPIELDLAGATSESDLTGSDELHLTRLSAGPTAVWLIAQDADGGPRGALIRLDAATGDPPDPDRVWLRLHGAGGRDHQHVDSDER